MHLEDYQDRFETARVSRDDRGVLTIQLHTDGDSLAWGPQPHEEFIELITAVASDRDNRVIVLTGTGRSFLELPQTDFMQIAVRGQKSATAWDHTIWEINRLVHNLLAIEVPMIAAVNGPVAAHSDFVLLCDIVLCAEDASFREQHFLHGMVPGYGPEVIWPLLLGPNRGRYFLLTGQVLSAQEALSVGAVSEVMPREQVLDRAYEIAHDLAGRNPVLLRSTRHALVRPLRRAMAQDLHFDLTVEALTSLSGAEWHAEQEQEQEQEGSGGGSGEGS